MYQFSEFIVEEDECLIKEYDAINSIIIVKSGVLEIVKEIDGTDLVVATVGGGAAINSRNILFPDENMKATIRCVTIANIMILTVNDLK
jgi:CRP-like cAMP-binding protein